MSPPAAAVDRAHLDRLGARFGTGFVAQMIDLFLAQGEELIGAARVAVQTGDAQGITSAAHALKSSAANLGAMPLSAQAAEVERLGREGARASALAPHVDALGAELDRVSGALRAIRAE